MIISFSGIDGCGKTTLASKAVEILRAKGIRARSHRVGDLGIARNFGNLLGKASANKAKSMAKSPNQIIIFFRKLSLLADALLFRIGSVFQGTAIVCDRYFYDSLVHLNYLGVSTNYFEKILLSVAPKPDISFLVTVPTEVAMARDREFEKSFYERKAGFYAELFRKIECVEIDNRRLAPAISKMQAVLSKESLK